MFTVHCIAQFGNTIETVSITVYRPVAWPRLHACIYMYNEHVVNKRSQGHCLCCNVYVVLQDRICDSPPTGRAQLTTYMRNHRKKKQEYEALRLHEQAGVPTDRPCTLQDVATFEKALNVQVVVFGATQQNTVIYAGPEKPNRVFTYLVPPESGNGPGHFHAITSPAGFLGTGYFCPKCLKPHNDKKKHRCDFTCRKCKGQNCPVGNEVICSDCHVTFQSQLCYTTHRQEVAFQTGKKKSPSVCQSFWQCPECKKYLERSKRSPDKHVCGEWLCTCCKRWVLDINHRCYLQRIAPKDPSDKLIFFDFECTQDTGIHVPNLVVAHISCSQCLISDDAICKVCGNRCHRCDKWDAISSL